MMIVSACLLATMVAPDGVRADVSSGHGTAYYVNVLLGNDLNNGTDPNSPWKTIARANRANLSSGDQLLFAAGQTFSGTLAFDERLAGDEGNPVEISSYGDGRAIIDAGQGDGLTLTGSSYVAIRSLNFAGCGRKAGSNGSGISLSGTNHITIDQVDAQGFRNAGISMAGVRFTRVTHAVAHDNGFAGITAGGGYEDIPRTSDLYIGYCSTDNNPGDPQNLTNHSGNGIVVGELDRGVIEYCEASNNGWDMPRLGNGPVGIWGWECTNLKIQHCISHNNLSPGADGGGFDLDGGCKDCVLQYNLSYDNAGCGYLLYQFKGASDWKDNLVQYNISLNDGWKNMHCGIGIGFDSDNFGSVLIINNTIVNTCHAVHSVNDAPRISYRNNIFASVNDLLIGSFQHSQFDHNLYWLIPVDAFRGSSSPVVVDGLAAEPVHSDGTAIYRDKTGIYRTLEDWAHASGQESANGKTTGVFADPDLLLPGQDMELPVDPARLPVMPCFRPRAGSPAIDAGIVSSTNTQKDFFGNPVPPSQEVAIGACQTSVTSAPIH